MVKFKGKVQKNGKKMIKKG